MNKIIFLNERITYLILLWDKDGWYLGFGKFGS